MAQTTLADLMSEAREMADQENSAFVSDSELIKYINKAYSKTYDTMVSCYGENYHVNPTASPTEYTLANSAEFYSLPSDFYKLLGVDICLSGNSPTSPDNWLTMYPFTFASRNRSTIAPAAGSVVAPTDYRYRIHGDKLWLRGIPTDGSTIRIWYVPSLVPLAADDDETSQLQPGWDELIVLDAAIKMCVKAEQDVSELKTLKQEAFVRLQDLATNRDAGAPMQTVDVYGPGSGLGDGDGGAWGVWF